MQFASHFAGRKDISKLLLSAA